jgi:hypothetical protein
MQTTGSGGEGGSVLKIATKKELPPKHRRSNTVSFAEMTFRCLSQLKNGFMILPEHIWYVKISEAT